MGFEIDYIPVGDGERSGDAIAIRYGNLYGPRSEQKVVIIDGGFQSSAQELTKHIRSYYGTDVIDCVISTHPDMDHTSGLLHVLEDMKVNMLLMHRPWEHAGNIQDVFARLRAEGIGRKLEESLQSAGIPIFEPFQGISAFDNTMHILGPSKDFYETLLPNFRGLPVPTITMGAFSPVRRTAEEAVNWIRDHVSLDLLNDDIDTTSAENNSSVITLFLIDGHKLLFTGDAGKTALHHAADFANGAGVHLTNLRFLDVPHHGSRRNLSTKLLKRIQAKEAIISAAPKSPKHPSKKVINALKKHNMRVYSNNDGKTLHTNEGGVPREGWVTAMEQPFHDLVEE